MRFARRVSLIAVITGISLMTLVSTSLAVTLTHPGYLEPAKPPAGTSSLVQDTSSAKYQVGDCLQCHEEQGPSVNNNHGLYLRPVTTAGLSVSSDNPHVGALPPTAAFSFTPGSFNRVDWIIGGLGLGGERYIYDSTMAVGPFTATYPRLGNLQWLMDFDTTIRRGAPLLGTNGQSIETTAWKSYSGGNLNYFTGTTALTETANDHGCVRCHSFGAKVDVDPDTGIPTYTIEEWGVTCANCHKETASAAHAFDPRYSSDKCTECHQRSPVTASVDTSGRAEQLDMFVWDTGQARNHRNQGYEFLKPPVVATAVAGTVETSGGAGHADSWNDVKRFASRLCMRCHTTEGYIARSLNGTDIPYSWTGIIGMGMPKTYRVDPSTVNGVSCVACHTSHGSQSGLNRVSLRRTGFEVCADCHRESNYPFLAPNGTFSHDLPRISHPQREMFLGYGGHGVSPDESLHERANVHCQHCHMPVSTGTPESVRSHLFKIVMPSQTMSAARVGFVRYPPGASATTPIVQSPGAFPDDSCTGSECHLATDAVKISLQNTIEYRQSTILSLLETATAKMAQADYAKSTAAWKKARINVWMVKADGSLGIHNFYYAKGLLDAAITAFDDILDGATPTTVALVASTTRPEYKAAVRLFGALKDDKGVPLPGKTLVLQSSADGSTWVNAVPAGSLDGTYTVTVNPGEATYYRWLWTGDRSARPATSTATMIKPRASLTTPATQSKWAVGTRYTLRGYLKPRYPAGARNVTLEFWQKERSGRWVVKRTLSATNANYAGHTTYSLRTSQSVRGEWRVRAIFSETSMNSRKASPFRYFTAN